MAKRRKGCFSSGRRGSELLSHPPFLGSFSTSCPLIFKIWLSRIAVSGDVILSIRHCAFADCKAARIALLYVWEIITAPSGD